MSCVCQLQVFKVCAPNKRLFALKRVNMRGMPEASQQGYREEVDLLRRLKGTHGVISMYSFEEFPRDHVLLMLLELGETDLQLLLQRKMEQWRKQGFTDPFAADPHFICCIWQDMLRVVQVLTRRACCEAPCIRMPSVHAVL